MEDGTLNCQGMVKTKWDWVWRVSCNGDTGSPRGDNCLEPLQQLRNLGKELKLSPKETVKGEQSSCTRYVGQRLYRELSGVMFQTEGFGNRQATAQQKNSLITVQLLSQCHLPVYSAHISIESTAVSASQDNLILRLPLSHMSSSYMKYGSLWGSHCH